jgi:molybdenum cofactor synthesis domain-containing protein
VNAPLRAAVVTVSDGVTHGTRVDESGDLAESMLREAGFDVVERDVVPDERSRIEALLLELADAKAIPLVVTTGGTGFGPRDVTPEATRGVIDREAPGLAELMRREGLAKTPLAALSRAVVGSRGGTLIVNLPGSPKGVRESLEAALTVVPHAVELLEGSPPCRVGNRFRVVPGGPVEGTLGCAEFDAAAEDDAAKVLALGEPVTRTYHHELGDVEVYLEPHLPPARLVVVSATEVALHLLRMGRVLRYETVLVEPRETKVTPAQAGEAGEQVSALADVTMDDRTDVVLTDHDAPEVVEALAHVLRSPARFVGVMGSRRHVGPYVEELRAMGFDDEAIARIRSPLGLDLGGQRPEEIAVSIAAGLVASRHGRAGGWLDER